MKARDPRKPRHIPRIGVSAAAFIVTALTLAATAVPAAPSAATTTISSGSPGQFWAIEQENSTHQYTLLQAETQAKRFDVITALPDSYTGEVAAMKLANPSLHIYGYMQGAFAQSGEGTKYPSSWYLRDASGNKIKNSFGLWLMNPAIAGWVNERISHCKTLISHSHYDGCYVDNLGDGTIAPGMVTARPINPATNAPYTNSAWIKATGNLAAALNSSVTGTIVANGLVSGASYFSSTAPTRRLLLAANMASAETFIRTAKMGITQYRSVSAWKQDVDMLVDASKIGHPMLTVTKVWVSGTSAQISKWQNYALASFLLGTNGRDYFTFSPARTASSVSGQSLWSSFGIGNPSAGYTSAGNAYVRSFAAGKVVVNPTSNPVTVSLGRLFKTLGGTWVSSITLSGHSGQILTTS